MCLVARLHKRETIDAEITILSKTLYEPMACCRQCSATFLSLRIPFYTLLDCIKRSTSSSAMAPFSLPSLSLIFSQVEVSILHQVKTDTFLLRDS